MAGPLGASRFWRDLLLGAAALLCLAGRATAAPINPCPVGDFCPVCGDGICSDGEFCPEDCDPGPTPGVCGNGVCEADAGETCASCPADCGSCGGECGNGICEPGRGETCSSCSQDCGVCGPHCGNGVCEPGLGETCSNCTADCGPCPTCNPPQACKPTCGNGVCESGETALTCPDDCGSICGDNKCDAHENCDTCAFDCCPFGGLDDSPCTKNTECYGAGGFKCDQDILICCFDTGDPRTCNPFPEMAGLPVPAGGTQLAKVPQGSSLPAWLVPTGRKGCRGVTGSH
jgi:hypothetical protein